MKRRTFLISGCTFFALWVLAARVRAMADSSAGLTAAIQAGDLSRVEQLLADGASPQARDARGLPALAMAAGLGNAEIVAALIRKGADVHASSDGAGGSISGVPVVCFAAAHGSAETLHLLLQAGAGTQERDGQGMTPLMVAAYAGNTETIPVLIQAKADLEARDLKRRTALMWAADGGRYEAARLLIDAGAEVNALGELNATPLMYAVQHGDDDVVALLVERGADLNRKAAPGLTALDLARQHHQKLTVDLLENGGRPKPPVSEFQVLRLLLYPETPFETTFLSEVAPDPKLEAARQLAVRGELQPARELLEAAIEAAPEPSKDLRWALLYLERQLGDRGAALASLRRLLAAPGLSSRQTLRLWKLMRDLGEAPPPELANRVLGVVVESGVGSMVLVVAAYADGQPRFFFSTGPGALGAKWSDDETRKSLEIVRLAQGMADGLPLTEDRTLPKPGRVRFIFLTPGGSHASEGSLQHDGHGRYAKLFAASDQLFGLLYKEYEATQDKKKANEAPPKQADPGSRRD